MKVQFHAHAIQRMKERGATRTQVTSTVMSGSSSIAKFGRSRFRKSFPFDSVWNSRHYAFKQIDAFAVKMSYGWFVITVIVKYY